MAPSESTAPYPSFTPLCFAPIKANERIYAYGSNTGMTELDLGAVG